MPNIPDIQTLTNANVRQTLGEGGFARSNQFQVFIGNGWGTEGSVTPFIEHLSNDQLQIASYGFTWNDLLRRKLAFSCFSATLPSSTNATGEMKDQYQGVVQEYAHTRINTDIDFSFYVDRNYYVLMFFEAWMNYIAGGNSEIIGEPSSMNENIDGNYYRRFNYPHYYMNKNGVYITKFEKNYNSPAATRITYQLINTFPKAIQAIPVQYGGAEIMKVSVTMYYDRYRIWRGNIVNTDGFGNVSAPGNEVMGYYGPPSPGYETGQFPSPLSGT